jgi:hypothetical protein
MANHGQRRYLLAAAGALSRRAMLIGIGAAPIVLFAPDLLALQDDGIDPKS